jgi:aa3 type cytochrome c oxidase subunit IV
LRENRSSAPLPCPKVCGIASREFDFRLGTSMADHSEVAYTTADGNDYVAHEQTYEGFIKLVKYGTASVALIVILMAIFLT